MSCPFDKSHKSLQFFKFFYTGIKARPIGLTSMLAIIPSRPAS